MTKHVCDITGKEIAEKETNYGRTPLVVDLGGGLQAHLQFVKEQRVNQSDVSGAAMAQVLDKVRAAVPEAKDTAEKPKR